MSNEVVGKGDASFMKRMESSVNEVCNCFILPFLPILHMFVYSQLDADTYAHLEWQQRGTPHIHVLFYFSQAGASFTNTLS